MSRVGDSLTNIPGAAPDRKARRASVFTMQEPVRAKQIGQALAPARRTLKVRRLVDLHRGVAT
jgi:hypothetical protein